MKRNIKLNLHIQNLRANQSIIKKYNKMVIKVLHIGYKSFI